jgi:alpha-galactosidase/6-phospho-beta-glucosidase family protein
MPNVALPGAGSGFTQPLFTDVLGIPGLSDGITGLVDIDAQRLEIVLAICTQCGNAWGVVARVSETP